MNQVIASHSNGMLEALRGKRVRPDGATTTYKVCWCIRSDSIDTFGTRVSSSRTPSALERHKTFLAKDKAQELLNQLQAAFKTLDYGLEGLAYIEEDWLE